MGKFAVGDKVVVVADYFTAEGDTLIGREGRVLRIGYTAVKVFDYGVRLDNPLYGYVRADDATGFDENELEHIKD